MRCPYQFYEKQILGKKSTHFNWEEMVQYAVNQVVKDYYKLPTKSRSAYKVLELIERYWIKNVELFDSKIHYYLVLAKVTDHLLQNLMGAKDANLPILLYEKLRINIDELEIDLAMTFQVVEWSQESFVVKKFLVEEDENIFLSFKHMAILFCNHAFQTLPERIEVVSLISGNTYRYYPDSADVRSAVDFFQLTRNIMRESKNYTKCNTCSYHNKCDRNQRRKEKEIQFVM